MNDITDTKYVKVFIGRFQPFHLGHLKVLRAAIDTADHVVVVIGSATPPRALKNPFSFLERRTMVLGALTPAEREKVSVKPAFDMPGKDSEWVAAVKKTVSTEAKAILGRKKLSITLIGCHKGSDTYYLKLYKGWNRDLIPQNEAMNATDVRRLYFNLDPRAPVPAAWTKMVPGSSFTFMTMFQHDHRQEFWALVRDQVAFDQQQLNQQIDTQSKEKP
jgi:bifunctional NMN adenylyltransferase/nudix hydrolase